MIRVLDKTVFALGLLRLAHHHAQRLSLSSDDAHDCASEFFLKHWTLDLSPLSHPSSYWHQCASHHALNYRRAVFRQATLLISLQEVPPTSP